MMLKPPKEPEPVAVPPVVLLLAFALLSFWVREGGWYCSRDIVVVGVGLWAVCWSSGVRCKFRSRVLVQKLFTSHISRGFGGWLVIAERTDIARGGSG